MPPLELPVPDDRAVYLLGYRQDRNGCWPQMDFRPPRHAVPAWAIWWALPGGSVWVRIPGRSDQ